MLGINPGMISAKQNNPPVGVLHRQWIFYNVVQIPGIPLISRVVNPDVVLLGAQGASPFCAVVTFRKERECRIKPNSV